MPSFSKPLYYLFRRNKYFFIGCCLGILLSSFMMPMLDDCSNPTVLLSSDPLIEMDMITVMTLNSQHYDMFVRLEQWFRDMSSTDYNPIIRNKSELVNINDNDGDLKPDSAHQANMVRDKKLKFYRPRFHSIELNVKMKLLVCILIRQQFLFDSLIDRGDEQSKSEFYRQLIGEYMNQTSLMIWNDFKEDLFYFYPDISTGNENNSNIAVAFNQGKDLEIWPKKNLIDDQEKPYHVRILNYLIAKKRINEYAMVLMVTEKTLPNIYNLQQYLQMISVSDLILSISDGISDDLQTKFLSEHLGNDDLILNHGLLISTSLIFMCYGHQDWSCFIEKTTKSIPDNNIYNWHRSFQITKISTISIEFLKQNEEQLINSMFIYPIQYGSKTFDLIRSLIIVDSIGKLDVEIKNVESSIKRVRNDNLQHFDGSFNYQKPRNRYEVTRWSYSNETHIFMPNDIQTIRPLNGDELQDILDIKHQCFEWFHQSNDKIKIDQLKIKNLYQKFDAVRGIEYVVDMAIQSKNYRFQILKPLNQVELLTDIPHVTENLRLTLILPVRGHQEVPLAINFLNHYSNVCLKIPNHQTILIIVLIRTRYLTLNDSIESILDLEIKEFERLKKVSLYLQTKYATNSVKIVFMDINPPDAVYVAASDNESSPRTRYPSELVYLDLISRSLHSSSSDEPLLIMHCRSNMLFSSDFLNRVRVNTIASNQIFIPVPFVEYQLRTTISNYDFKQMLSKQTRSTTNNEFLLSLSQITAGQNLNGQKTSSSYLDVRKENGYFDERTNELISFYLHDYIKARKQTETLLPIVRNRQSIVKYQNLYYDSKIDLFRMFQRYNQKQRQNGNELNQLIVMRSVEPDLKLFHTAILDDCDHFESNQFSYEQCLHRQTFGLGPKQKLGAILDEYIERKFAVKH